MSKAAIVAGVLVGAAAPFVLGAFTSVNETAEVERLTAANGGVSDNDLLGVHRESMAKASKQWLVAVALVGGVSYFWSE